MRTAEGFAAVTLLVFALAGEEAHAQAVPSPDEGAEAGARVDYGWMVRPLDEERVELEAYRGKVLFINAWASWCLPCVREMGSIERLSALVADTDIEFLLVAVERESSVRRHLRRHPLSLSVFLEEERFPPAFGLRGIPMTWIVDREGRIAYRHFGAADWDIPAVEDFLRELANASAP